MIALCSDRRRSPVPLGGKEECVTITSSQRSDMTAAGQSILRPSFPAEIRQAASGAPSIWLPLRRRSSGVFTEGPKDNQFV